MGLGGTAIHNGHSYINQYLVSQFHVKIYSRRTPAQIFVR